VSVLTSIRHLAPEPGSPLRIVQLTDCHLGDRPGSTLLGVDTDLSLAATVDLVLQERPVPDLVLATGDLANHGSASAYLRLLTQLERLNAPVAMLPGNHDDAHIMQETLRVHPLLLCKVIVAGCWQIIMLESQVAGEVGGTLGPVQLAVLDESLATAAQEERYSLLCLHHHPVPIGSAWLDEQQVSDAAAFFEIVDRYTGVRGILWGHVHQALDRQHGNVRLMCSPSTCVQFAPGSRDFQLDATKPGYRWLDLFDDGRIASGISRLVTADFEVDLNSRGYLDH